MTAAGEGWELRCGDSLDVLAELAAASVDAIVCDPPYGLSREPDLAEVLTRWLAGDDYQHRGGGFMGRSWDSFVPGPSYWREALRVLKPGGHMVVFGGTRTFDLLATAIRLAGFEIRDTLMWMYGSGFPKSLDVARAIDKAQGTEGEWRQEDHPGRPGVRRRESTLKFGQTDYGDEGIERHVYEPGSEEARRWGGWGTALKPSWEPIMLARKLLAGTVATNVLAHGVGALNVGGCRIAHANPADLAASLAKNPGRDDLVSSNVYGTGRPQQSVNVEGRWPANVMLAHGAACRPLEEDGWRCAPDCPVRILDGQSGASRFFYCAKTGRGERDAGLDQFEVKPLHWSSGDANPGAFQSEGTAKTARNHHPTVKPIDLMRWLVRLVTPPGGLVLDPFAGSGSTGCAAVLEGARFLGVEREPEYVAIAAARIAWWREHPEGVEPERAIAAARGRRQVAETGQLGLLGMTTNGGSDG